MNWATAVERCRACGAEGDYAFPLAGASAALTGLQCRACGEMAADVVGAVWPVPAAVALRVDRWHGHVLIGETLEAIAAVARPAGRRES